MSWTIERVGHVAVVGMNSHVVNVQGRRFFDDLDEAFDRLERDYPDCAVVLGAEGRAFSAGLDFREAFAVMAGPRDGLRAWATRYIATNVRVWTYPRPTVAAVHGAAIAGGFITALDCDVRVATPDARFCLNEVPIGIAFPTAYVEIIRASLGDALASRLMLSGQSLDVAAALQLGVVNEVVAPDELRAAAIAHAARTPVEAFAAYAHTKRAIQRPLLERIERLSVELDALMLDAIQSPASVAARAARAAELAAR